MKAPATTHGIRDVAAAAGVSVGTVSNVLNRPQAVAPATRARVEQAIAALGFVRNESARQLRAGRSRTLGLVEFLQRAVGPGQCRGLLQQPRLGVLQLANLLDELVVQGADMRLVAASPGGGKPAG